MAVERCPQCGTARQGNVQVCLRCEATFSTEPVDALALKGASPTQSHGSILLGVVAGFLLLGVLLWFSVRDVGPFTGAIQQITPGRGEVVITVLVTNEGDRTGRGTCTVGVQDAAGTLQRTQAFTSKRIEPGTSVVETIRLETKDGETAQPAVRCT